MAINSENLASLTDTDVVDRDGAKVGGVGQIYLDDATGQPAWVSVKSGLFGLRESFVPLGDADVVGGNIQVPFGKEQIKNAPRIDAENHLDDSQQAQLYEYYGVARPAAVEAAGDRTADFGSEQAAEQMYDGRTESEQDRSADVAAEQAKQEADTQARQEAAVQEEVVDESPADETATDLPVTDETATDAPAVDETVAMPQEGSASAGASWGSQAAAIGASAAAARAAAAPQEPVASEPVVSEPVVTEPVVTEPVVDEVAAEEVVVVAEDPADEVAFVEEVPADEALTQDPVVMAPTPVESDPVESDLVESESIEPAPGGSASAASHYQQATTATHADWAAEEAPEQPVATDWTMPGTSPEEEETTRINRSGYSPDQPAAHSAAYEGHRTTPGAPIGNVAPATAETAAAYEQSATLADDDAVTGAPLQTGTGYPAGAQGEDEGDGFGPQGYLADRDGTDMTDEERARLNQARGAL